MSEIVENGRTGLHFAPGNPNDLATTVEAAWTRPERLQAMGREARHQYETRYTASRNYRMLMDVYEMAMAERL